jgi:hypothetical protein
LSTILFKKIRNNHQGPGYGWYGQLGHNGRKDNHIPKRVQALADEVIVQVACRLNYTFAFTSAGSIFTFGLDIAPGHDGKGCFVRKPVLLQDLSSKGVICFSAN